MKLYLPDVNVLLYAQREESPQHEIAKAWLKSNQDGVDRLVLLDHTLFGFLRIITHRRIFPNPTPLEIAIDCVRDLLAAPAVQHVSLPPSHVSIFERLCVESKISGEDVPDAYLAAAAMALEAELVSADKGFARFSGLRWSNPFE